MRTTVRAIYENGVLRPLEHIVLTECQQVTVTVETDDVEHLEIERQGVLDELFGSIPEKDIQEMEAAIDDAFERIDPNEW